MSKSKLASSEIKQEVEDFISDKQKITAKRSNSFESLFAFVLDSDQWTNAEEKERKADGLESLIFNFSSDYVDRYLARLFPRNQRTGVLEVGVKVYNDKDGKKISEIMGIYRKYYLPSILIEQGINFLIGGAACLYYPQNPRTKKAEIISLNPRNCSLAWSGDELVRFAHKETFTDGGEEIIYCDKNLIINILIDADSSFELESKKNPFGFIPVSWIPSFPKPHSKEGRSKILQLIDLDVETNKQASNFSKRVDDNTIPHVNVFSDTANAKKEAYTRGRKKVSYLKSDDDVRMEEVSESAIVLEYLDFVDKRMRRKTGIVDIGGAIKAAISGVSLSFQFSEMMDLIGFMRVFWDRAFREMNDAILTYKFGVGDYDTDPVYNPALAFDSKIKTEEYILMLDKKLISRKDAISELRAVEDPDEVIRKIIEEDKLFDYMNPKVENQIPDGGKKVKIKKVEKLTN